MIPRNLLPQIPEHEVDNFIKYCKDNDVDCKILRKKASSIKPIQKDLNKSKIKDIVKNGQSGAPLIVSGDNYLMDGHHRWAASLVEDLEKPITCLKFSCPIKKLILMAHLFDGSEVRGIKESLFIL